jgi:voltage-gated potassium channel
MPALSAHVRKTAEARLAVSGDLATAEIEQAVHDDQPVDR